MGGFFRWRQARRLSYAARHAHDVTFDCIVSAESLSELYQLGTGRRGAARGSFLLKRAVPPVRKFQISLQQYADDIFALAQ